jgi:putative acetyltransferase
MIILEAQSLKQINDARVLFREYESGLDLNLCFQNFEDELINLPGKYAPPEGRLFVAYEGETPGGCIALRKLEDGVCEMKRLFVRTDFQGRGLGRKLIEKVINEARVVGYKIMRLDTLPPKMKKAVSLYEAYGFKEIPAYYHNPNAETLFMEKDLNNNQEFLP